MVPRHLYVHVPFCARRCTYCDFAIAVRSVVPVEEYLEALEAELSRRWGAGAPLTLETLYFGGGTPSRLGADGVSRMIEIVARRAHLERGAEVTIEANPEDVSVATARRWRQAGITRVSLGVQSFDDRVLAWMHRVHDAERAERAIGELRDAGLPNVSVDLIFALPESLGRSWTKDLDRVVAIAPPHVSLYGLTVEEKTPLGRMHSRNEVIEAPDTSYERDFLFAHSAMTAAGLQHYEVSNFGRESFRSRHNSSYWTRAPYAAVGPGAHEFDGEVRRWNVRSYSEWVARLRAAEDPIAGSEQLTRENISAETVYLGLRTVEGLPISRTEEELVGQWIREGWAVVTPGAPAILRLTALGWLRLDSLAAILTEVRSR